MRLRSRTGAYATLVLSIFHPVFFSLSLHLSSSLVSHNLRSPVLVSLPRLGYSRSLTPNRRVSINRSYLPSFPTNTFARSPRRKIIKNDRDNFNKPVFQSQSKAKSTLARYSSVLEDPSPVISNTRDPSILHSFPHPILFSFDKILSTLDPRSCRKWRKFLLSFLLSLSTNFTKSAEEISNDNAIYQSLVHPFIRISLNFSRCRDSIFASLFPTTLSNWHPVTGGAGLIDIDRHREQRPSIPNEHSFFPLSTIKRVIGKYVLMFLFLCSSIVNICRSRNASNKLNVVEKR